MSHWQLIYLTGFMAWMVYGLRMMAYHYNEGMVTVTPEPPRALQVYMFVCFFWAQVGAAVV